MKTISKPRKAWIAGLLTIVTIGLGHVYSGEAQKGILLYLLGFIGIAVFIPLYLFSQNFSICLVAIAIGIVYLVYCFIEENGVRLDKWAYVQAGKTKCTG
jgi:signal peptidase I